MNEEIEEEEQDIEFVDNEGNVEEDDTRLQKSVNRLIKLSKIITS